MESSPVIRRVERALDELKRGYAVRLNVDGATLPVLAAEGDGIPQQGPFTLVLSAQRAAYLGLGNTAMSVRIPVGGETLLEPLLYAPRLEMTLVTGPATAAEMAAVELVKLAGFIPTALIAPSAAADALEVNADDVNTYRQRPVTLALDNIVRLPLNVAEEARLAAFNEHGLTHLAVLIGRPEQDASPLARLHSSCFTGDILGSLRCDCGNQLQEALRVMAQAGSGVLLYLNQEGRGIGLINKLRAYRLQEEGLDTVDANLALGFAEDERDFAVAAEMLRALGITTLQLLTNNPQKLEVLRKAGINITERVPLQIKPGVHNKDYLATKTKRLGHKN